MESEDDGRINFRRFDENSEIVLAYEGNYIIAPILNKLDYIDPWFENEIEYPWYLLIFISLFSAACATISVFPYTVYESFLPDLQFKTLCVARSLSFGIIFFNAWIEMHISFYKYFYLDTFEPLEDLKRKTNIPQIAISVLFVFLYSGLYAWKWFIEDVPIKYASLLLSFVSLARVFYGLIQNQLKNSSLDSISERRRKILLNCLDKFKKISYFNSAIISTIAEKFKNLEGQSISLFSIFFAVRDDIQFFTVDKEELLIKYEEDLEDSYEHIRINFTNLYLGVIWLSLTLVMMEDYGYAVFHITKLDEEGYLWLVMMISGILSGLYIFASYGLVHAFSKNLVNLLTCRNGGTIVKNLAFKIPFIFSGLLIASLRMNSSYIIFGRIAAKFAMPYSIGFTLIWVGMLQIFLLDLITSVEMVSRALENLIILVGSSDRISEYFNCVKNIRRQLKICYCSEKIRRLIFNLDDDGLRQITRDILCREFLK